MTAQGLAIIGTVALALAIIAPDNRFSEQEQNIVASIGIFLISLAFISWLAS